MLTKNSHCCTKRKAYLELVAYMNVVCMRYCIFILMNMSDHSGLFCYADDLDDDEEDLHHHSAVPVNSLPPPNLNKHPMDQQTAIVRTA